jgi:hypothetical protein
MEKLPKEVKQFIFTFLDPCIKPTARLVDKEWCSLIIKTAFIFRALQKSEYEAKIQQLSRLSDQIAIRFPFSRLLDQETIENGLTKLKNLVSLDISLLHNLEISLSEQRTDLDRLEYLSIYRPLPNVIASLTSIRQLVIQYDYLQNRSFKISTTIEDLAFESVITQTIDPEALFNLTEYHSRLTKLRCEGVVFNNPTNVFASLTQLKNLRDLRLRPRYGPENYPMSLLGLDLVSLDLANINVSIEEITTLTRLTKLALSGVDLIFRNLTKLTNLKTLEIMPAHKETFWTALTGLEDVTNYATKDGSFVNLLPTEHLTRLFVSMSRGGYEPSTIESSINRLSNLKTLGVSFKSNFNFQRGIMLPNLSNLSMTISSPGIDLRGAPNLTKLTLCLNQPLQKLDLGLPTKLEHFFLSSSVNRTKKPVQEQIFPNLANLTSLKALAICWPSYIIHENLPRSTQLEYLHIELDGILEEEFLQRLTNLTTLKICTEEKESGKDIFLPIVPNMTRLQELVIPIYSDALVLGLTKLGNLTQLKAQKFSARIQFGSVTQLTSLRYLELGIESDLSSYDLRDELFAHLPFLDEWQCQ